MEAVFRLEILRADRRVSGLAGPDTSEGRQRGTAVRPPPESPPLLGTMSRRNRPRNCLPEDDEPELIGIAVEPPVLPST